MKIFKIIKRNMSIVIIILGAILRVIFGFGANPLNFQHDVNNISYGHLDYAVHFFKRFTLPNNNFYEFHQPPLNAVFQGAFMRFISSFYKPSKNVARALKDFINSSQTVNEIKNKLLQKYIIGLYSYTKVLTVIYSIIILIMIYKILQLLFANKNNSLPLSANIVLAICAIYPGMIMNATQYGNDGLSYMFFFISLYLGIKWFIDCDNLQDNMNMIKNFELVPLAFSIGFGMMTKISVGAIAFILAPLMLYRLFATPYFDTNKMVKSKETILVYRKKIIIQFFVFGIIVFPLGMWYPIRNYLIFNQPIGGVPDIAVDTILQIDKTKYGIIERFLSFPIGRLFDKDSFIFHNFTEYNVWIDLIKTATFDEFSFDDGFLVLRMIIYILNIIFIIVGFFTTIFGIIDFIKSFSLQSDSQDRRLSNYIGIMLVIIALIVYIKFNVEHQFSCNSNYRYIMYITLGMAINIVNIFKLTMHLK